MHGHVLKIKELGKKKKERKTVASMALDFGLVWVSTEKMWMPHLVHLLPFMGKRTGFQRRHCVANCKGFAISRTELQHYSQ